MSARICLPHIRNWILRFIDSNKLLSIRGVACVVTSAHTLHRQQRPAEMSSDYVRTDSGGAPFSDQLNRLVEMHFRKAAIGPGNTLANKKPTAPNEINRQTLANRVKRVK